MSSSPTTTLGSQPTCTCTSTPTPTPIAIVGMGCRFAGKATSPTKLWQLLSKGGSAWSKIPSSRFETSGGYHPNGQRLGSSHVRGGHFLEEDPALFDASFFNMTAESASSMDPQYRLMLEVVYESLESAGIPLEAVAGTQTSVFAGTMYQDYHDALISEPETLPRYTVTGNVRTMAANRISHFYDLRGPSVTIDTACSTTLTALHLACASLRAGDSDTAIVVGANLALQAHVFSTMSNLGFLSPEGISYAFDPRANGYGRGEGVAAIVLKTLPNARQNHDPIRATIRATALNQDGRTPSLTAPSAAAQADLLRACYRRAGFDDKNAAAAAVADTAYVEAHGTGTPTGDPLEMAALAAVFTEHPVAVGSVKANIGHTEAASGLAAVIKVALSLEKGLMVPHARFLKPDKRLLRDRGHIQFPRSLQKWSLRNGTRRASIQNYGFGGSNAAAILEAHNPINAAATGDTQENHEEHGDVQHKQTHLYVLSAKDEQAVRRMVANLRDHLQETYAHVSGQEERRFLANLAYTLGSRRSVFPWTVALAADSLHTLVAALANDNSDAGDDEQRVQPRRCDETVRLAWVFTGQGAQWHAMGRELIEAFPVFRASLVRCDGYIRELGASWSILEELHRDEATAQVNKAEFSLPLSTAIQIALVDLLWSWGVRPIGIASHSSGEAAAAYAAGALSARCAIGITYLRGMLTGRPKPASAVEAGMTAVGLGREEAEAYIARVLAGAEAENACLVVGCVNSPSSVTVSGDVSALAALETLLAADKVFARRLQVTEAFHSKHMLPMADAFRDALYDLFRTDSADDAANITSSSSILYTSPKTGTRLENLLRLRDVSHWTDSMLHPVEFASAMRALCWHPETHERTVDLVVEIGPHNALAGPIQQIRRAAEASPARVPSGAPPTYLSCLRRGHSALATMFRLAAELTQRGHRLAMDAVNFPHVRDHHTNTSPAGAFQVLPDLPSYPWNHQTRYWREPRCSRARRHQTRPRHDLIGLREPLSPPWAPVWAQVLRVADVPWTRDHIVGGDMVLPGAAFLSMAIEGIAQAQSTLDSSSLEPVVGYRLREIEFTRALVLPADVDASVDMRLTITACEDEPLDVKDWYRFSVHSHSDKEREDAWIEHCTGYIQTRRKRVIHHVSDRENHDMPGSQVANRTHLYHQKIPAQHLWDTLLAVGIRHGPLFQNMVTVQESHAQDEAFCTFAIANTAAALPLGYETPYQVHPTTLDSVFQAAYTPLLTSGARLRSALVPWRIQTLEVSSAVSALDAGHLLGAQAVVARHEDQPQKQTLSANVSVAEGQTAMSTGRPLIEMQGLKWQSWVDDGLADDETSTLHFHRNRYSTWTWAPKLSLVDMGWLQDRMRTEAEPQETSHMMDLRRCVIHFLQDAAAQLTPDDTSRLDGHWAKFHTWMTAQLALAHQNKLAPNSASWLHDTADQRAALQAHIVRGSVNGEMLARLGPVLAAILRRDPDHDPLALMMDGRLLTRYYASALKWSRANAHAGELVRLAAHEHPRCRILEIGAGTGGCTAMILRALAAGGPDSNSDSDSGNSSDAWKKHVGRYDFTDISAGFFEQARQRFAGDDDDGVMTFRTLDIATDPLAQGFETASYDIIVACQVLHATANVRRTLRHVRTLLKPGGQLVLVETTHDQLDLNLVFGLLPGWWLSDETERQARATPSLSRDMWHCALRESGFGDGVACEVRDCDGDDAYMISTMLATATADINADDGRFGPDAAGADVVLLHADKAPPPQEWLRALEEGLVPRTTTTCVRSLRQADPAALQGKVCVFLGELAQALCAQKDDDAVVGTALVSALASSAAAVLWVSRGAAMACEDPWKATHLGLLRTLRNEHPEHRFVSLDVDPSRDPWTEETIQAICRVFPSVVPGAEEKEFEFAERDGILHVPRAFHVGDIDGPGDGVRAVNLEPFHQPGRPLRLDIQSPGLLDSLCFREDDDDENDEDARQHVPDDWVEIEPKAFGLTSRDVKAAMDQRHANRAMGFECSGVIKRLGKITTTTSQKQQRQDQLQIGDRVCALVPAHWATTVRTPRAHVVRIPDTMSFDAAAALPQALATAYLALHTAARIQAGDRVLIHLGASSVGQAAIALAQRAGAEVFATAGTPPERDLLRDKYRLAPDHILSSRDGRFVDDVRRATQHSKSGPGVDVVLNSLAGDLLLQASVDSLAEFGRFVELGAHDAAQHSRLGLRAFSRNLSFSSVDVVAWQRAKGAEIAAALREAMRLLVADQSVAVIAPVAVYPLSDVAKAFSAMQGAQQDMGKIVVSMSQEEEEEGALVPVARRTGVPLSQRQRPNLKPDGSYVVVGGLSGIGRRICRWLVNHGARHLVLLLPASRTTTVEEDDDGNAFVASLEQRGCTVRRCARDASESNSLLPVLPQLIQDTWRMPPIRGIVHAAMLQVNLPLLPVPEEIDKAAAMIRAEVQGSSWDLHQMTAGHDLDFFVMLSSLVGTTGGGVVGLEANYAAASVFLDALANHMRAQGRPAVTIDLGTVKNIIYTAAKGDEADGRVGQHLARMGYDQPLYDEDVLALVEKAIRSCFSLSSASSSSSPSPATSAFTPSSSPVLSSSSSLSSSSTCGSDASWSSLTSSCPTVLTTGIDTSVGMQWDKTDWLQEDRFQGLKDHDAKPIDKRHRGAGTSQQERQGPGNLRAELDRATTHEETIAIVLRDITGKMMRMFGLREDDLSSSKQLASMGVDSLVAIELRNWVMVHFDVDVSLSEVLDSVTIDALAEDVARKCKARG